MKAPPSPGSFQLVLKKEQSEAYQETKKARNFAARWGRLDTKRHYDIPTTGDAARPDEWPDDTDPMVCICCGRRLLLHGLTERCY